MIFKKKIVRNGESVRAWKIYHIRMIITRAASRPVLFTISYNTNRYLRSERTYSYIVPFKTSSIVYFSLINNAGIRSNHTRTFELKKRENTRAAEKFFLINRVKSNINITWKYERAYRFLLLLFLSRRPLCIYAIYKNIVEKRNFLRNFMRKHAPLLIFNAVCK